MTRRYDELPPVEDAPLSRRARVVFFAVAILLGSFAGAFACALVLTFFAPLVEGLAHTMDSVFGVGRDGEPFVLHPLMVRLGAIGMGIVVGAVVTALSICKQIDAAKVRIHVAMYREVIEEHIRDEASRRQSQ